MSKRGESMKLYTGNYSSFKTGIAISKDGGKEFGFTGKVADVFCPDMTWSSFVASNENLPLETAIKKYVQYYYSLILKRFNEGIIMKYFNYGDVILSGEHEKEISHRHILGAYIELFYGIEVREAVNLKGKISLRPRNKYYKTIKEELARLIKNDIEMSGYSSIAAAHARSVGKKFNADNLKGCPIDGRLFIDFADFLEASESKKHR